MKKISQMLLPLLIPAAITAQQPYQPAQQDTILKKDTLLKEVIVIARKPLLTHAVDRTIVHVEAMISASTSNALEMLGKTPGLTVDNRGVISLNGRSDIQVLINGRPTYLSAEDLAGYLRSLPGSSLDKIELIDNPPARYDASGNGVINLQLKRSTLMGISGQLSTGFSQGNYPKSNHGLNFTYYTPRLRWYNNLGFNTETTNNRNYSMRTYYDDQDQPIDVQIHQNSNRSLRSNKSIQSGIDYRLSSKTTIGLLFNYSDGQNKDQINFRLNKMATQYLQQNNRTNKGLSAHFLHKLRRPGTEWSGEFNYLNYHSNQDQEMNDFNLNVPARLKIWTANTDLVYPVNKTLKLETGYKTSRVSSNNGYHYTPVISGSEVQHYPFLFNESIQAFYLSGQKRWARVALQLGLRAEHTSTKGTGKVLSDDFQSNYFQAFPTLHLSYKLDSNGHNNLVLMANRRINRPNYHSMNPYILYLDRYNYNEGNPQLQPQYMHRLELKFQRKQWLQTSVAYTHFRDVIFPVNRVQDSLLITRVENIDKGQMFIWSTTVSLPIRKGWHMQTTTRLLHAWLTGQGEHHTIRQGATLFRLEWRNDIQLGKTWQAELGAYFVSKDFNAQMISQPFGWLYGSVQKKILKNKGSIRLSFDDMLRTNVFRAESFGLPQTTIRQNQFRDSQRIGLAFTYSFGKKGLPKKSRSLEQAGDERSRL
jgi:hypothetical protein